MFTRGAHEILKASYTDSFALVERWSSKDRVLTWDFCLKNDNHGRYFTRVCNFFSFTLGFYTIKLAKVC